MMPAKLAESKLN